MFTDADKEIIKETLSRGLPNPQTRVSIYNSRSSTMPYQNLPASVDLYQDSLHQTQIGSATFLFTSNGIAELSDVKISQNRFQGQGYAKTILRNMATVCDKYNFDTITTHAAEKRGGYVWALFGFIPNQESWNNLRVEKGLLQSKLDKITLSQVNDLRSEQGYAGCTGEQFEAAKKIVQAALCNPDPKAIWVVADSVIGNVMLSGSDWHGKLKLKDESSRLRFENYIEKGREVKLPSGRAMQL